MRRALEDAVIVNFADEAVDLREQLAAAEADLVKALADAEAYRLIGTEAIHALAEAGRRERSLREQVASLRDEIRRYTQRKTEAAA